MSKILKIGPGDKYYGDLIKGKKLIVINNRCYEVHKEPRCKLIHHIIHFLFPSYKIRLHFTLKQII